MELSGCSSHLECNSKSSELPFKVCCCRTRDARTVTCGEKARNTGPLIKINDRLPAAGWRIKNMLGTEKPCCLGGGYESMPDTQCVRLQSRDFGTQSRRTVSTVWDNFNGERFPFSANPMHTSAWDHRNPLFPDVLHPAQAPTQIYWS
ncbi:uncharacterized protein METZ01_LOCUS506742 [marine metagenome]|uniref:Uncharacterized protein n=1 Tax=marine metagenome TaxID=408172 RepID=A0A383ECP5_9ZZZZ